MSDDPPPSSLRDLDERLKNFRGRIDPREKKPSLGEPTSGLGVAFTATTYLVTGIAVGGLVGWLLDAWLRTGPWLFVVFFFLGAASGVLNVYRMSTGLGMAFGYRPADDAAETAVDKTSSRPPGERAGGREKGR